jgi:hypothetical protein
MGFHISRKSLPDMLREAGAPGSMRYIADQGGRMVWDTGAEQLTPGEAAQRFLPPCDMCGKVWPRCTHD